jgi:hypothetical protein
MQKTPGDLTRGVFCILVEDQFPGPDLGIMPDDVDGPIVAEDFKIAVIRRQPLIEHLSDIHRMLGKANPAGRLFAPIAGVTIDVDLYSGCICHRFKAAGIVMPPKQQDNYWFCVKAKRFHKAVLTLNRKAYTLAPPLFTFALQLMPCALSL